MVATKLPDSQKEAAQTPVLSPARQAWRRFRRHKLAILGGVILLVLVLLALIGPSLVKFHPNDVDLYAINQAPSKTHLMGTDNLGRDELARIFAGGRISLSIGLSSALVASALGTLIGAVAGYYSGWVDLLLMRLTEVILSVPLLPLLMVVGAVFKPGPTMLVFVIAAVGWMGTARLIRAQFLQMRTLDYVEAAHALGAPASRVIFRHMIPNTLAPVVVAATLAVGHGIILESVLSFLGLGVRPPQASWGNMLQGSQSTMTSAPWLAIFPGLFILVTVLAVNFLGDGLRDALDPRANN